MPVNDDRIVIFGWIFRSVSIRSDHNAFQCVITPSFHKYFALSDQITQKQIDMSMAIWPPEVVPGHWLLWAQHCEYSHLNNTNTHFSTLKAWIGVKDSERDWEITEQKTVIVARPQIALDVQLQSQKRHVTCGSLHHRTHVHTSTPPFSSHTATSPPINTCTHTPPTRRHLGQPERFGKYHTLSAL